MKLKIDITAIGAAVAAVLSIVAMALFAKA